MKHARQFLAITFSLTTFVSIGAAYAAAPKANAPCNPSNSGGSGNDTITCTDEKNSNISGNGGNDTITLNGQTGKNSSPVVVSGGTGDDSITNATGGTVFGNIDGGNGNDTIVNNGTINPCGCNPAIDGGAGNDTVINNGKVNGDVTGGTGDDNVTNNGKINGDLKGGGGNDTVTNNGTVNGNIKAGNGQDTYTNNGTVNGNIDAILGSNNITNNGDVKGNINLGNCVGCNNLVVLGDNATVEGTVQGAGAPAANNTNVLQFNLSGDNNYINSIASQIVAANPAGGSITINGVVYKWKNLTGLIALLHLAAVGFQDGRINPYDRQQTITGWCRPDGSLDIWAVDNGRGQGLFLVTARQLALALKQAVTTGKHVLIKEQAGRQLWALSTNQLQIHDARGFKYDFIFVSTTCGPLPVV